MFDGTDGIAVVRVDYISRAFRPYKAKSGTHENQRGISFYLNAIYTI